MTPTGILQLDRVLGGFLSGDAHVIVFDDVYVKTSFMARVITSASSKKGLTVYLDLDTAFTVHLQHGIIRVDRPEDLLVYTPDSAELDGVMAEVCSMRLSERDLIIFDSVTAFQNVRGSTTDASTLNRKIGVYLALLQDLGARYRATILITTMLRSRKIGTGPTETWFSSPSGGRVLKKQKGIMLSLKREDTKVLAEILKHPDRAREGSRLYLPLPLLLS